jgi:hypothetical protein
MRITLHIGLPKTATTTMQAFVFPQFPGYLGLPYDHQIQRSWRRVLDSWSAGTGDYRGHLEGWVNSLDRSGLTDVLLSDESLSTWPCLGAERWPLLDHYGRVERVRPHPILPLLRSIRVAGQASIELRVIVSFRKQSDFVGSLYAQLETQLLEPSQDDFETKLRLLLKGNDPFFDWPLLVRELQEELDPHGLLVLFFEDGVHHNVRRLSEFVGWDFNPTAALREPKNVKRTSASSWRGRGQSTVERCVARSKRYYFGLNRRGALSGIRRPALWLLRRLASVANLFQRRGATTIGSSIEVDTALAVEIRNHFAASNRRLGDLVNRDLSDLGY